jgi:hypothetical protein
VLIDEKRTDTSPSSTLRLQAALDLPEANPVGTISIFSEANTGEGSAWILTLGLWCSIIFKILRTLLGECEDGDMVISSRQRRHNVMHHHAFISTPGPTTTAYYAQDSATF